MRERAAGWGRAGEAVWLGPDGKGVWILSRRLRMLGRHTGRGVLCSDLAFFRKCHLDI